MKPYQLQQCSLWALWLYSCLSRRRQRRNGRQAQARSRSRGRASSQDAADTWMQASRGIKGSITSRERRAYREKRADKALHAGRTASGPMCETAWRQAARGLAQSSREGLQQNRVKTFRRGRHERRNSQFFGRKCSIAAAGWRCPSLNSPDQTNVEQLRRKKLRTLPSGASKFSPADYVLLGSLGEIAVGLRRNARWSAIVSSCFKAWAPRRLKRAQRGGPGRHPHTLPGLCFHGLLALWERGAPSSLFRVATSTALHVQWQNGGETIGQSGCAALAHALSMMSTNSSYAAANARSASWPSVDVARSTCARVCSARRL